MTAAERKVDAEMRHEIAAARSRILEQTLRAAVKICPNGYFATLQRRSERAWREGAPPKRCLPPQPVRVDCDD